MGSVYIRCEELMIEVRNKESRIDEVTEIINVQLAKNSLSKSEAASLFGKLVFAESQTFFRMSGLALVPISQRASTKFPAAKLDDELNEALLWARDRIMCAPPKLIRCKDNRKPCVIFTDGAFELTPHPVASAGAVLFLPDDNSITAFGSKIPEPVVNSWRGLGSKQVIHQAELLPVLIALLMWSSHLNGRRVFIFVDNEGAKSALINHSSSNFYSRKILRAVAEIVTDHNIFVWFGRVPSKSNIADGPSRLKFETVQKLNNASIRQVDWTETCQRIGV